MVCVMELPAAIKDVGCERCPVCQRQRQIGARQHHIVAPRRSARPAEDQIGPRQVDESKLGQFAPCHEAEIRAAIVGLPGDSRRETEAGEAARE